eukprot:COSAG02_NODE_312_length_24941_cov_60.672611_3_plen_88_part_00
MEHSRHSLLITIVGSYITDMSVDRSATVIARSHFEVPRTPMERFYYRQNEDTATTLDALSVITQLHGRLMVRWLNRRFVLCPPTRHP